MANTVSYHDEELARFYGVVIKNTNKGWVIQEFRAKCAFTGRSIFCGAIECVRDKMERIGVKINAQPSIRDSLELDVYHTG